MSSLSMQGLVLKGQSFIYSIPPPPEREENSLDNSLEKREGGNIDHHRCPGQ